MHSLEQSFSHYQKERCINILNKLSKYHISIMFSNPVDPLRDQCPDYLQVIRHPMDLGTVRENIQNGNYSNVEQFKKDVNLIWENCYRYNGRESFMGMMAKQLQSTFKELSEFLSSNDIVSWAFELDHLKNEVNKIAKSSGKTESIPQFSPIISSTSPKKPISRQTAEIPSLPLSRSATRSFSSEKEDTATSESTVISIRRSTSKKIPLSSEISKIINSIEVVDGTESSLPRYSLEEQQKLVDDVNSIYDVNIIHKIINMIKQNNSDLSLEENDFDEVEVKISEIKQSTLIQIREYLDSLNPKPEDNSN